MSAGSVLSRRWPLALAALFAAALPARAGDEVRISVVAVLATTKNNTVDERVACIARQMEKIDPKLTGFSLARMTCKNVQVGNKDCFEVVDGQFVCVTVEKKCDKENRYCLKVEPPGMGAITYNTSCGKFLPLVTRYKSKGGEVLIVAVGVKACPGE
jgi:hypothetical protein